MCYLSVDTRFPLSVFILIILCFVFPFLGGIYFTFLGDSETRLVENIQALMLLFFALFSYFYMKPLQLAHGQKQFWLWAVCWWVVLFGRSTSWGRDYFPEIPKIYFRAISVVLIGSLVFPLFRLDLRQEIAYKFKTILIPFWGMVIAFVGLIISDAIEHDRYLGHFFISVGSNKNFLEELYEFPLILGLFIVAYELMKNEKKLNDSNQEK